MTPWDSCFLMLNSPRGGVDNLEYVAGKAPWVRTLFLNVKDYEPAAWSITRDRAQRNGIATAPWARISHDGDTIDWNLARLLSTTARQWTPSTFKPLCIVNAEKELDGAQDELERLKREFDLHEWALSMEPIPFANLDWRAIADVPVLPQSFSPIITKATQDDVAKLWHSRGIKRVYHTFGTFGSATPSSYRLEAPFSLYTGDPLIATTSLEAWAPSGVVYDPTGGAEPTPKPPTPAQAAPLYNAEIAKLAREWEDLDPRDSPLARLTIIRRIAESSDDGWYSVRALLDAALDNAGIA